MHQEHLRRAEQSKLGGRKGDAKDGRKEGVDEDPLEMRPLEGMRWLMKRHGWKHARKEKKVGRATHDRRYELLERFLEDIDEEFHLQKLGNLGDKHISWYLKGLYERCESGTLARKTAANYITPLRQLLLWMDKKGMNRPISYFLPGVEDDYFTVAQECVVDKGVPDSLLDAFIARVEQLPSEGQRRVADIFRLMRVALHRMRESVRCDLHRDVLVKADSHRPPIRISEGTKGSRPREFELPNDASVNGVRLLMQKYTPGTRVGALSPSEHPDDVMQRVYDVCKLIGFTRNECGYTPHGIRHEGAHKFYEQETGERVAVKGGDPRRVDPAVELDVRFRLSRMLGHNRQNICSYYGVLHSKSKRLEKAWANALRSGQLPGPGSPS